jgi:coproporphyrinogen III oxidase-like Fe-S oxidoreductase
MKVNMNVDTIFKTEIDNLGTHIDNASADQIAELREQNKTMQKNHKDDLVELRNQTALLYQYITNPAKSIIKMDSYRVGESLVSRY